MNALRHFYIESLILKIFVVCCLIHVTNSAYNSQTAADDNFNRKGPMDLVGQTLRFLSSGPDKQLLQKLSDLRSELLDTNYLQLAKDVLESGVLGNGKMDPRFLERLEEIEHDVDADDRSTTTPATTLTTPESSNTTTGTYSTTEMTNISTAEYSTTVTPNLTTTYPVSTTSSPNGTTSGPTPAPVDPKCLNDTAELMVAIAQKQPWAKQMIDADGKPGPNLEGYQFFWVGDYDECRNVTAVDSSSGSEHVLFKGQYCTIVFPFQPWDSRPLMPAVPPMGFRIGLCVPDSCSGQDITYIVNNVLETRNISLRAGLTTCQEEEVDYDAKAIVVLLICSVFLLLMLLGTVYDLLAVQWPARVAAANKPDMESSAASGNDYSLDNSPPAGHPTHVDITREGENEPLLGKKKPFPPEGPTIGTMGRALLAFSVYTNGKKILNASHTPGSISCIHGIRFLSMTWVILGHTFVFSMTAAENYATFVQNVKGLWTFQAILGGPVSVDTFFSLSGLLVTYLILKEMEKREGKVQWFLFYFHRFWRLTPPYAFVMMMLIALFRYFGSGPNWLQNGTEINECQNTWWTNLLYINNFVKVDEMCMNWSWYLANDMQFYIISPLLFVPLFFWRKVGVVLASLWLLATMITAGVISKVNNFPPSVSLSQGTDMMESATYFKDLYIKPYCRFGPYVVGMLTGYALFITKRQVKMHLVISLGGWATAIAAGLAVVYGLYGPANGHPLTADVSALYNAVGHTVWGACVCWVIFACATGYGGPVNTLLSWTAFIPLSRLTYTTYLVHPIIMNLYHLGAPAPFYMTIFHCTILFLGFTVAAFGCAFILSLAFEAPMMALEKVFLPQPRKH